MEGIRHFNSIEVARILGVNVSTVKRWTEEGKLECIKTAGGHRKFLMAHLGDYVKNYKKKHTIINLFPMEDENDLQISYRILKHDYPFLIDYVVTQALESRLEKVQQVLNGLYLGQHPLHKIYDRLITPALHRLGQMWHNDELSIIEEHFGSQTIRDSLIRLQGIISIPSEKIGRAICLNLSTELHDIALKMVANILELRGYQVYFSGQFTDIFKIEYAFEKFRPERIYLSCTWVEDLEKTQAELEKILKNCDIYNTSMYLGGQGVRLLKLDHPRIARVIDSFEDVQRY
ncbi:MAG: cobalamin B12-binding domain-containing protein [Calditrichae bacterium]|nr:cobalamin B12-binding domain-containing protein [Calditrichia bacterium]